MDYIDFILAFGLIFLAEIGDKTQLMAMSLQIKYRRSYIVMIGVIIGMTLVLFVGLLTGIILKDILNDITLLKILAGLIFFFFAFLTFRELQEKKSSINESENNSLTETQNTKTINARWYQIIFNVAILMFLAEMGDKTQLLFISLIVNNNDLLLTTIGGLSALIIVDGIGVGIGQILYKYISERSLNIFVIVLFLVLGIFLLLEVIV